MDQTAKFALIFALSVSLFVPACRPVSELMQNAQTDQAVTNNTSEAATSLNNTRVKRVRPPQPIEPPAIDPTVTLINSPKDPKPTANDEYIVAAIPEPPEQPTTTVANDSYDIFNPKASKPLQVTYESEEQTFEEIDGDVDKSAPPDTSFLMLGTRVPPGTLKQLTWTATETYSGTAIPTPVLVAHGEQPGPVLCMTGAVHGDELNGIETVSRVVHNLNLEKLKGTIVAVPIVNIQGFQRHSRYLPDRRDLNRFFPGHPRGSSAARIAYSFFNQVIRQCEGLVDVHTGSFHRTNLPQLRADLNNQGVVELTKGFGSTVILHSPGAEGTLRRAAANAGIPAVTLEAGEPLRVQESAVKHCVKGIHTLLDTLGMYNKRSLWGNPEPAYYTSAWVRTDQGGILFSQVKLGKRVVAGDLLGSVTDPITNEKVDIASPYDGRVIGMALNQFVMPGFATFHLGIETEKEEATEEPAIEESPLEATHSVAFESDRGQDEE